MQHRLQAVCGLVYLDLPGAVIVFSFCLKLKVSLFYCCIFAVHMVIWNELKLNVAFLVFRQINSVKHFLNYVRSKT